MEADLYEQCRFAGKNHYELLIHEGHVAIAYGGVDKRIPYLTARYRLQSLSALVQSLVSSCETCQQVMQYYKPPLVLVTLLHDPVRPWTDI